MLLFGSLIFPSTDHDALLEGKDCEVKGGNWAVTLLRHLFTKLAIDNKYIMTHNPKFPLEDSCGCIGDTSFGRYNFKMSPDMRFPTM